LDPGFNGINGREDARFRPIGVPNDLRARPFKKPLRRIDFIKNQRNSGTPVIFVKISDKNFGEGVGYDLAKPPKDEKLQKRVKGWWQLSHLISGWARTPNKSPGLLIGIHGTPGSQLVVASIKIDRKAWGKAKPIKGKLYQIPVVKSLEPELDAFNLRGRRVDHAAGLSFAPFRHGHFRVLKRNCHWHRPGDHR